MSVLGDPAGYELAYRAGLDAISGQQALLRETRDRAGTLMSSAAVAGGLAAGLAFNSSAPAGIGLIGVIGVMLGVGGFVGTAITTVLIWRPTDVRFTHDAGVIVAAYVEGDPPAKLPEVHRELALWLGKQAESNRAALEVQLRTFTWGLLFLLVEIFGLVLALGDVANG